MIRWEHVGEHALPPREVAAIVPSSRSAKQIQQLVEALYATEFYTPAEMLAASRRGGHNPYRAKFGTCSVLLEDGSRGHVEWLGEVICGHNPYLVGRLATVRPTADGSGHVTWEDDERPSLDLRDIRLMADRMPRERPS